MQVSSALEERLKADAIRVEGDDRARSETSPYERRLINCRPQLIRALEAQRDITPLGSARSIPNALYPLRHLEGSLKFELPVEVIPTTDLCRPRPRQSNRYGPRAPHRRHTGARRPSSGFPWSSLWWPEGNALEATCRQHERTDTLAELTTRQQRRLGYTPAFTGQSNMDG